MAITKVITPDLIDLPFNNTDGIVLAKGTTSNTLSIQYLVVAGGGGGGGKSDTGSGGGGAGGLLTATADFASSTNYGVDVGLGGDGGYGSSSSRIGVSGGDSVFDTIVCKGGGGGGAWVNPTTGGTGGSGGGSAYGGAAGQGTSGQGNNGGVGSTGYNQGAGGGGGAGGVGLNGVGDYVSGNGGVGLQNTITGASPTPYYAGGGGGGTFPNNLGQATRSTGGLGGGADGNYNANGIAGDSNTGGGGGGTGSVPSSDGYGGNGGSGVIILRMISTTTASFSTGVTFNLNNTDVAGQNIYTITATTSGQTVTFSVTGDGTGRPTTNLSDGEFRYNTTTKKIEFYDGADWFALTSSASVPQAGTTGVCNYPTTATALYQLETSGADTCAGTSYDGTINGTGTSFTSGKFGDAATFDGSNGTSITFPAALATTFRSASAFGISFWFKATNNTSTRQCLFDCKNDTYIIIHLLSGKVEVRVQQSNNATVLLTSTASFVINTWYNIIWTGDAANGLTLYVNGASDQTSAWDGTFMTYTVPGYKFNIMGQQGSNNSNYTGQIDQLRVFTSFLTQPQATALATETAP